MRRKAVMVAAVVSLCVAAQPGMSIACSCVSAPAKTLFSRADAVFAGQAVAIESPAPRLARVVATLAVEKVYKGEASEVTAVHTPSDPAACGVAFVAGNRYEVFAERRGAELETTICHGTTDRVGSIERAGGATPKQTFEARATGAGDAGRSNDSDGRAGPIAAATVLILVAASALTLSIRRRPSPPRA